MEELEGGKKGAIVRLLRLLFRPVESVTKLPLGAKKTLGRNWLPKKRRKNCKSQYITRKNGKKGENQKSWIWLLIFFRERKKWIRESFFGIWRVIIVGFSRGVSFLVKRFSFYSGLAPFFPSIHKFWACSLWFHHQFCVVWKKSSLWDSFLSLP